LISLFVFSVIVKDKFLSGRVRRNNDNRFGGNNLGQEAPELGLSDNPPPQHDKLDKHHGRRSIEFGLPLDWFEALQVRPL
jgi:hypothetical protein